RTTVPSKPQPERIRLRIKQRLHDTAFAGIEEPMLTTQTQPISLSDSAASKVRELIMEEGNPNLQLRIYVSGGGCSGFQYGFAFEETAGSEDIVLEKSGVRVLIDPVSLQYLNGA